MTELSDHTPSSPPHADGYAYRRPLRARELSPAIGAAIGAAIVAGVAVFYFTRLYLERAPLLPVQKRPGTGRPTRRAT